MISGNQALPNGVPNYNATTGAQNNPNAITNPTTYNYNAPNITPQSIGNQTANGQSVGGYQMPDYTAIANQNNANSQSFNQAQRNQVGDFTGAYNAAAQALPTFQTLNDRANAQFNVQPLAENAANLQNTLLQVPRTYSQAVQGSDTNNNQLMQLIGQKQWELGPIAQAATNSAQAAQQLANNSVGYGIQNEAQLLSPYANTVPLQGNLTQGAYANFTQQQSDQLNALEQAVMAGAQLSGAQLAQLASLQNAKTQANALTAAAQIANQNYLLNPYQQVYNTISGQAHTNTL